MCRIFGYVNNGNNDNFDQACMLFADLAQNGCVPCGIEPGHNDGWGTSMWGNKNQIYYRSIDSANQKDLLNILNSKDLNFTHGMIHLRKGTKGIVAIENTHPFLRSGISFCHNGSIHAFPQTDFTNERGFREGHTDSETFFLRVMARLGSNITDASLDSLANALKEEIEEVKKTSDWTALIVMMGSKEGLVLNYLWNEKYKDSNSLCFDKYYTFYIGKNGSETILCSEKLPLDGFVWEQIKNDSLLVFPINS